MIGQLGRAFLIIVFFVGFAFLMVNLSNELKSVTKKRQMEWKHFVAKNDCQRLESYFGAVEKWECGNGETHWH